MDKIRVLAIVGSLRRDSYNHKLLCATIDLAPEEMEVEQFDLKDIPIYNQDNEVEMPLSVKQFKQKIKEADAVLFVTPEYNYSIPGVLKNAIDWGSRPYGDNSWQGKPVAVMGASTGGMGTVRAQFHLRQVFVFLDMHAVNQPEVYVSKADTKFDENGSLNDEQTKEKIRGLLQSFVQLIKKLK